MNLPPIPPGAPPIPIPALPPPVPVPLQDLDFCLDLIGFDNPADRANINDDGLENFQDFWSLTKRDIVNMAESFGKRTVADVRMHFGTGQIKRLQGLMHWIQ